MADWRHWPQPAWPRIARVVTEQIRFDDGAAYERYMGKWSQLVGEAFIDWLAPQPGLRWLDIGCGNGAFTEMLIARCAPSAVEGIDPSAGMLGFARTRLASAHVQFQIGDAMALPYANDSVDAAVMPLVIFFVPDPATGVGEMARVVRGGGLVTAYAWDMEGGGFPYELVHATLRELGVAPLATPNPAASQLDTMRGLWRGAGLVDIATREITVRRSYAGLEDYWATILGGPSVGPRLAAMAPADIALLKSRIAARLPTAADGRITCSARANAIKGRCPA